MFHILAPITVHKNTNKSKLFILEIKFNLNNRLFLKDPQDSELGKKMIEHSIILFDELGFEAFTFKKLATAINSTEKSIYRYFENKHFMLLFLSSWYWEWVKYLIEINSRNIEDPERKLKIAIQNLVNATDENPANKYINEHILHKVVIKEGGKAYHIHDVDDENKAGLFYSYESLVKLVSEIILEIEPKFPYSLSLSSNLFEMANNQIYFAEHLPRLSSISCGKNINQDLIKMLSYFAFKIIGSKNGDLN